MPSGRTLPASRADSPSDTVKRSARIRVRTIRGWQAQAVAATHIGQSQNSPAIMLATSAMKHTANHGPIVVRSHPRLCDVH